MPRKVKGRARVSTQDVTSVEAAEEGEWDAANGSWGHITVGLK